MDNKYIIDTRENMDSLQENVRSLLEFGRRFPSPGGSSYYLGDDGTPWTDRNRETWITSRMIHVYSIGKMLRFPGCKELAEKGLKGLLGELKDTANGGWFAGVTKNGEKLEGKQCYAHAFVMLAASSAYLAGITGAKELLDEATAVYDRFFWNEEEGLSSDTWNTEFTVLDDYRGLNANMHTVEAFLAVADALKDEKYRVRAGRIIDRVSGWAEENNYRLPEHFTKEWKAELNKNIDKPDDPFKPYGATPGHGIEWARLIVQWASSTEKLDKTQREAYIKTACALYDRAVSDAWNADGEPGIVYTTDWDGKPVVHDRMHWTLAEAINTSSLLYRITGKKKYSDDYSMFMEYLDNTVLDHTTGSWFHQLDEKNKLKGTVWPGKSDLYHAFQSMLIPYSPVNLSIATAVGCSITGNR
ncbi:MAG: AGE family epimerase/isomerase [Lachnospiraceae bacterium]|nr:AGE family epimerase/isomerase [Lachnospiraceae bacterium]